MRSELHPRVKEILKLETEQAIPKNYQLSAEGSRQYSHHAEATDIEIDPEVEEIRDYQIPSPRGETHSLPIRVYFPDELSNGPFPITLWFHGGGWVRGGLESNDYKCRILSEKVGCTVVSVDYRLAPEHKFPAALEDCYATVEWVEDNSEVVCGDPNRIAVAGSSAGGNLAAAVSLMARDNEDTPSIQHQVLAAPVLNYGFDTKSYRENSEGYGRTRKGRKVSWDQYLEKDIDGYHPYASPLKARKLTNLPSATILTAGFDPGRTEGRQYAERLQKVDIHVNYSNYEDMPHRLTGNSFLRRGIDRTLEAYEEIAEGLREAFK